MAIPDVTNVGTTVVIDFAEPNIHYSAITAYDIKVKNLDGTFSSVACTETASVVLSGTLCTVNTASIKTLTSLPVDSLIRVKVRA